MRAAHTITRLAVGVTAIAVAVGCHAIPRTVGPLTGPRVNTPAAVRTAPVSTAPQAAQPQVIGTRGLRVLPDRQLTPGAVDPRVTQANIRQTICLTGYTTAVRPSESYTEALKRRQIDSGYNYHGDLRVWQYEEDHLVPLEVGGAPSDTRNLWPQFDDHPSSGVLNTKDLLENRLHDLVCSGRLPLAVAQHAIATNWWSAYQTYGGQDWPTVYFGRYRG